MEEELNNSKNDSENLEIIYKYFSCKCDSNFCESVHYLLKIVDKFFKGQSNFEIVLASQKCVFGKVGLGFNPNSKKISISKPFSSSFGKRTNCFVETIG